ncbi:hypothetical protein KAR91_65260 [Candidatus Pacearchaeota archaeon]|nr:hypothetical protein [Candidatus Pacearchaeota archaeon]
MSILSELLKKRNWRMWLKGLLSATISGGATGIVAVLAAPHPTFRSVALVMLTAGASGMFMYFKKQPMPEWEDAEAEESNLR